MCLRRFLSSLLLMALLLSTPLCQASDNSTHAYHLKNGLLLLVKEDHRAPVVLSSVWYKVGSSYEQNGLTGISHMLEHMMFRGTKQYGPGVFNRLISEQGGEQNAFTTDDFTTYYQTLPVNQLELSLKLEADRMQNLSLSEKTFTNEHQVVMEERRMRIDDNPEGTAWERLSAAAHVNNPYHHPTIGWMTDIQNYTVANLQDWYNTWYTPNNAVIIVVGDVKPTEVHQLVIKYFGHIPSRTVPVEKPRTEIAPVGSKQLTVTMPRAIPHVYLAYPVPVLTSKKQAQDAYALSLINAILDVGRSSRLQKNLVRGQRIASQVSVSYLPYRLHEDLFVLSAIPAKNVTLVQLQKALEAELTRLKEQPLTAAELKRVTTQFVADQVYDQDELMNQAFRLGQLEMVGLPWTQDRDFLTHIQAVTPQQIQTAAQTYFKSHAQTVLYLRPPEINKPKTTQQEVKQ